MLATEEILEGFGERLENIAVFKPLFELEQKRKYDYSLLELGLGALLFILEKMLVSEDCTYRDIARFLQGVVEENYGDDLSYEQAEELTHYLVRDCLLNQGRPHQLEYKDIESGSEEKHKFHLVQLKEYEIDDKVVKLELSPVGLELLFKTKEMYNELQVSISQLYLKQQIQKGVFDGALRSVRELKLAVKNEQERLKKLREQIIRDVLQVTREGAYRKELDRINDQLNREQETFQELMKLVEDTLEHYHENYQHQEIDKVMELKSRLLDTMRLHESLLTTKMELQNLMNKSMENMILNTFSTTVNFETEILETVVNSDVGINKLKRVIEPFLSPSVNPTFNLNRIFEPQRLYNNERRTEEDLWEVDEEKLREKEAKERRRQKEKEKQYRKWLLMILEPLLEAKVINLSEVIKRLKESKPERYQELATKRGFYPFILKLHQLGEIPILSEKELETVVVEDLFWVITEVVEENPRLKDLGGFELEAKDGVIELAEGYVLSEFIIRRVANG